MRECIGYRSKKAIKNNGRRAIKTADTHRGLAKHIGRCQTMSRLIFPVESKWYPTFGHRSPSYWDSNISRQPWSRLNDLPTHIKWRAAPLLCVCTFEFSGGADGVCIQRGAVGTVAARHFLALSNGACQSGLATTTYRIISRARIRSGCS
jgi:hypothetical protein